MVKFAKTPDSFAVIQIHILSTQSNENNNDDLNLKYIFYLLRALSSVL